MAYDEKLAERIRELVSGEPGVTEQKMFGGLAFLVGGNMAIAASGQGGALVHVDPDESDRLLASTNNIVGFGATAAMPRSGSDLMKTADVVAELAEAALGNADALTPASDGG